MPTDKLYTGQRKDSTTGLYYYKARYYDPEIGRFLSPDSVMPDLTNPQSLNRYSYVWNNPLKANDPTGNWPNFGNIMRSVSAGVSLAVNAVKQNIDIVQTVLDVAGMIPVVGEAFDCINGAIYAARGDYVNAALSFAAMIPVAGNVATGAKLAVKVVDKVVDVAKAADRASDAIIDTKRAIDNVPTSLLKGKQDTYVYLGMKNGTPDYVGVTNNLQVRKYQHGDRFDYLHPINSETLTRNQAKSIEQVIKESNPQFSNIRNSISPSQYWYNDAIAWAYQWLNKLNN